MRYLIAFTLALVASSAWALPTGIWCYNCTPAQVTSTVLASSAPVGTPIYVGDVVTGAVGAYMVFGDVDDSHKPPIHTKQVENTTADPAVINVMQAGISFYKATPIGWHKVMNDVYDGPDPQHTSAYNVSDFGQAQINFNAWRNSAAGLFNYYSTLAGRILQGVTIVHGSDPNANPTMQSTTTFGDGTEVTSQYDTTSSSMKINPDLSVDSENNPIPYVGSDGHNHHIVANRHFTDDGQGQWNVQLLLNKLQQMHIPVTYVPAGGDAPPSGGGLTPQICVETPGPNNTTQVDCYPG